ncbi:MAG: PilC/PilY family type IV pilus protein [Acidobacteriota bacterium]
MRIQPSVRGVKHGSRFRGAVSSLLLLLTAVPGRPDDRQLLQANQGANTNVLLILDSSHSMNDEFAAKYRLPAYMDDFLYPQGTSEGTSGSKLGVAKSVLRQTLSITSGVNWAFAYYRNPNQTFGAADTFVGTPPDYVDQGLAIGGAKVAGDYLENGGLEWMYFADSLLDGSPVSSAFASNDYPDIQSGRFLQMGHKVMRNYGSEQPVLEIADVRPPYSAPTGPPSGEPTPGTWRGAFGPHGEGQVIYRSPSKPGSELRIKVSSGKYSDASLILDVEEWAPPPPTFTPNKTKSPTQTITPGGPPPPTATKKPTKTATPIPPTPTPTPKGSEGQLPVGSRLPVIASWMAPAVRGMLAMVPPPPQPAPPCPGIPAGYPPPQCAPCPYDLAGRSCSVVDANANGAIDPGEFAPANFIPLPSAMRGFDDPQADPTQKGQYLRTVSIKYTRGDLYNLPPQYLPDDLKNGNPPWGSRAGDGDADGKTDGLADRHNQGMFAAIYDKDRSRGEQQYPSDAFAEPSCPLNDYFAGTQCDVYVKDCGGLARYLSARPCDPANPEVSCAGGGYNAYPDALTKPPSSDDWVVVPFKRDYIATDTDNAPVIKRLLRFASSIVSYDSAAPTANAYQLKEDAKNVVVTAPGTPIGGALHDAYNYFVKSVFPGDVVRDDKVDCRKYIVVFLTDGLDECGSQDLLCSGGPTGGGPGGDLGEVLLPESVPGARAAAHAIDPMVPLKGIPVYMIGLGTDLDLDSFQCIADKSGGKVLGATSGDELRADLASILNFQRGANVFASPSLPAFSSAQGNDSAQIGAVIPSHQNLDGSLSSWSVWNGSLKSYKLDPQGLIPVVTAAPATPTPTPTGVVPTATPGVPTPTPTPIPGTTSYPNETLPDGPVAVQRMPVWNAARLLGYTDPSTNLDGGKAPSGATPAAKNVWPGRKMVFARAAAGVPLLRADFMPDTPGVCDGACFNDLMTDMGLTPGNPDDTTLAIRTVQFLRGGTKAGGTRDEILNLVKPGTIGNIGPGPDDAQMYSYYYQDDAPAPGDPPQTRTDGSNSPPGYGHKLGDIFHSEPLLLQPPRYFQYLSANVGAAVGKPYLDFANRQALRRRVLFAGANDGFLHAFDAGVWDRDPALAKLHDLGTGREIFAYAPLAVMKDKFPSLLTFPPVPQYFVDGSMAAADVLVDPIHSGTPTPADRLWRTVLVGGLRQGGSSYYALDVTQPDDLKADGSMKGNKDASPACLNGAGASCKVGGTARRYPEILWELNDAGTVACSDSCGSGIRNPAMGETWSRPVIGRIRVITGAGPVYEDRYVAIFGGGFDPAFSPGEDVDAKLNVGTPVNGRTVYIVDVETGKILYKATQGDTADGAGLTATVKFAPVPAPVTAADYDDDGYLDVVYVGDVNGHMWRLDVTPDASTTPKRGELVAGRLQGYKPFLLFNGCGVTTGACTRKLPIFFEPGIVYLGGAGGAPPPMAVAFGTGDRSDLTAVKPLGANMDGFYYVVETGQTTQTMLQENLRDLTPGVGPGPCPDPSDLSTCVNAINGFVLSFASANEKSTSTVYSTLGYLSLVTFTPDSPTPCGISGSSYRYRFFYLTGQPGYPGGAYGGFQETLGSGVASASQTTNPAGGIVDTVFFSQGATRQDLTPGTVRTMEQNWKEQE